MQLSLRLLPPRSYRLRHRPPEWEVLDDAGKVVGWIEEHHIGGASSAFFILRAVHPSTAEIIPLELSASIEERVRKLESFLQDPDKHSQHYPSMSQAEKYLRSRVGPPP